MSYQGGGVCSRWKAPLRPPWPPRSTAGAASNALQTSASCSEVEDEGGSVRSGVVVKLVARDGENIEGRIEYSVEYGGFEEVAKEWSVGGSESK